jgi:hypothetical protein
LFRDAAAAAGFRFVSESSSRGQLPFGIVVARTQSIEQNSIDRTVIELLNLSRSFDGDYDGWETPILAQWEFRVMAKAYRVFVVLDREYGERLLELAGSGPVWIVDTPRNRAVAQHLWVANPNRDHLDGVTTFKAGDGCSSEEILINELDTIDLHHGSYSADPPYTVLEVIGTPISERLKAELSHYGFNKFQSPGEGFRTLHTPPDDLVLRN